MYATCASETSSCRLLFLRGGDEAEAEAEAVVRAEAERENKERRRKMRVTELNIVRIDTLWIGWLNLGSRTKKVGWDWNSFFVAVGC